MNLPKPVEFYKTKNEVWYMQIKKIIWKFEGIPIRKADDTRESKYITNQ